MRKPIIILGVFISILVCCTAGISFVPKTITIGMFDFKKFSDKGFLFTPHDYSGEYESIGLVSALLLPSAKIIKTTTGEKSPAGRQVYQKVWDIYKIDVNEALDSLYFLVKRLNGDAIVDLQINEISQTYNTSSRSPQLTIFGYKIAGFAIKRIGTTKGVPAADSGKTG